MIWIHTDSWAVADGLADWSGLSKYKTGKLVIRSFWGINPHTYGQLTYDKEGKNIQWRKDSFFSK